MSAAVERSRRSTAGKRMGMMVGKAQEEDELFWNHDTWAEGSSDNESFRSSDEDSDAKKDEFDSDFNDSEDEEDSDEPSYDDEEEKRLQREEKQQKSGASNKKRSQIDISKIGRDLMQKKKGGKGKKRVMGDGLNAGIVLNFPGATPPTIGAGVANLQQQQQQQQQKPVAGAAVPPGQVQQPQQQQVQVQQPPPLPPPPVAPPKKSSPAKKDPVVTRRRRTTRAHDPSKRSLRQSTQTAGEVSKHTATEKAKESAAMGPKGNKTKQQRKRLYTQGELLLEAVNVTEPENIRWLLGRKRSLDLVEADKERALAQQQHAQSKNITVLRFHSRRGYLNTINFPDMDHVPSILTQQPPNKTPPPPKICVITGQRARYSDPLTGMNYYDLKAFKELRRRHKAGEPLDQRGAATSGGQGKPNHNQGQNVQNADPKESITTSNQPDLAAKPDASQSAAPVVPSSAAAPSTAGPVLSTMDNSGGPVNSPAITATTTAKSKKGGSAKAKTATKAKKTMTKKPKVKQEGKTKPKSAKKAPATKATDQNPPTHQQQQGSATKIATVTAGPAAPVVVTTKVEPGTAATTSAAPAPNTSNETQAIPNTSSQQPQSTTSLPIPPSSPVSTSHLIVSTKPDLIRSPGGTPVPPITTSSNNKVSAPSSSSAKKVTTQKKKVPVKAKPTAAKKKASTVTRRKSNSKTSAAKRMETTSGNTTNSTAAVTTVNTTTSGTPTVQGNSSTSPSAPAAPGATPGQAANATSTSSTVPSDQPSTVTSAAKRGTSSSDPAETNVTASTKTTTNKAAPSKTTSTKAPPASPSRKSPRRRKPTTKAVEAQIIGAPPLPDTKKEDKAKDNGGEAK